MLRRYQSGICCLFRITDVAVVLAAWLASYWLRFCSGIIPVTEAIREFGLYAALTPLVAGVWMGLFSMMHVYESRRMVGQLESLQILLRAHGMALLIFLSVTYFIK